MTRRSGESLDFFCAIPYCVHILPCMDLCARCIRWAYSLEREMIPYKHFE